VLESFFARIVAAVSMVGGALSSVFSFFHFICVHRSFCFFRRCVFTSFLKSFGFVLSLSFFGSLFHIVMYFVLKCSAVCSAVRCVIFACLSRFELGM